MAFGKWGTKLLSSIAKSRYSLVCLSGKLIPLPPTLSHKILIKCDALQAERDTELGVEHAEEKKVFH